MECDFKYGEEIEVATKGRPNTWHTRKFVCHVPEIGCPFVAMAKGDIYAITYWEYARRKKPALKRGAK